MSRRWGAAVLAISVVLAAGCTSLVPGEAVSVFDDPFNVAGMPATHGPSGLRPNAPEPDRKVQRTDGGQIDELAAQSVSDVEEYWQDAYQPPLEGAFNRVNALISWDARGRNQEFCGENTLFRANAGYCPSDKTIGWDRGELLPELRANFGDMAITMVIAHEYGHAVQRQARLITEETPVIVAEQQADCLSGAYLRWVAEGNSPRFTLNTGEGLNNIMAAMISFRDPILSEDHPEVGVDEHGSAFERISAFQFGFTDGPSACAEIDAIEVSTRRGDLPVTLQSDHTGEWPVSEESVQTILEALDTLFPSDDPPKLTFVAATAEKCPDARPIPPVSYCPATNTIAVDMPALKEIGAKVQSETSGMSFGDNTAYSVLASRYALAIQAQRGVVLDDAAASLRTACLTGVATTKLSEEVEVSDDTTITLTAGDLDEAVSGILTNGLAASDVNGETVPSGFSRIDAFRTGVLGNLERCFQRYP